MTPGATSPSEGLEQQNRHLIKGPTLRYKYKLLFYSLFLSSSVFLFQLSILVVLPAKVLASQQQVIQDTPDYTRPLARQPRDIEHVASNPLQDPITKSNPRHYHHRLERRSAASEYFLGGKKGGGGNTQVSISLQRVKNPDDDNKYKKKKFPIMWLRNQYPFNKKKPEDKKYKNAYDPLHGQYSSNSYDVLDPNPSTWVKIPDRPTATIRFQKQSQTNAQPHISPPLPQPMPTNLYAAPTINQQLGLIVPPFSAQQMLLHNQQSIRTPFSPAVPNLIPHQLAHGIVQTSEVSPSRDTFHGGANQIGQMMMSESSEQSYNVGGQPAAKGSYSAPAAVAGAAQPSEPSNGFGGISLSFGNGRSISFGGGNGLTIGGRAGAISIGGNKGSAADNSQSASGYSESKSTYAAGGNSGSESTSSGGGYGSSDYGPSKHPTMSVDVPRKGKKIIHANLDMAPLKVRLHSSPRVKITTGSRDPLEKPSDEELSENEEDIFEPPEPFPKRNTTSATNETTTDSSTTPAPTQLNGTSNATADQAYHGKDPNLPYYPNNQFYQTKNYGQHHEQQSMNFQQQSHGSNYMNTHQSAGYHSSQQPHMAAPVFDDAPANNNQHHIPQSENHHQNHYNSNPNYRKQPEHAGSVYQQHPRSPNMVPLPDQMHEPHHNQQQMPINPTNQPLVPMIQQDQMPVNPMNQPQQIPINPAIQPQGHYNPALNQWRQFSREAKQQIKTNQFAQQQNEPQKPQIQNEFIDDRNNNRFYNGAATVPSNSINEMPMNGRTQNEGREQIDLAASSQQDSYAPKVASPLNTPARKSAGPMSVVPQHEQFNPSTVYQMSHPPNPEQTSGIVRKPTNSESLKAYDSKGQQPQSLQPQASNYYQQEHYSSHQTAKYAGKQHESHNYERPNDNHYHHHQQQEAHPDAGVKTYTIGRGGISTSYGPSTGYSSSGGYSSSSNHYGPYPSDGFDQKLYQAKVEQFEPDAHDKRERTKVVLFLKPRISIMSANSSTTTKRPKNQQRLVHVITRPIFLNTTMNGTNTTHHDEEFIDPDLKEPMDVYHGYGYGYGYGYSQGYNTSKSSYSSTKKPKPKTTTTTTTTTTASPTTESETTTTSTESTTTPSDDSSSTTSSDSSTTSEPTSTTEAPSSSTESSTEDESKSSDSSSSTTEGSTTEESSDKSTTASDTESTTRTSGEIEGSSSTTEEPVSSEAPEISSSSPSSGVDLVSASTEDAPSEQASTTTLAPTTSSTTSTTTTTPKPSTTTKPPTKTRPATTVKAKPKTPSTTTTTTTTTTSTTTTTTETPETTTTTSTTEAPTSSEEPDLSQDQGEALTTTTTTESTITSDEPSDQNSSNVSKGTETTTTTESPTPEDRQESTSEASPTSPPEETELSNEEENISEATTNSATSVTNTQDADVVSSPSKRSLIEKADTRMPKQADGMQSTGASVNGASHHKPMLLNEDLIDKLMQNTTLVGLMSGQLKKVVNTDQMSDEDKHRIVRQVFEQMMEKKVDFSMKNVRLAVKTVSSSYRAAAAKTTAGQQKKQIVESSDSSNSSNNSKLKSAAARRDANLSRSGFGRRDTSLKQSTQGTRSPLSKSFTAIDTALKLTKKDGSLASGALSNSRTGLKSSDQIDSVDAKVDPNGNPIVVVLLPQDKA